MTRLALLLFLVGCGGGATDPGFRVTVSLTSQQNGGTCAIVWKARATDTTTRVDYAIGDDAKGAGAGYLVSGTFYGQVDRGIGLPGTHTPFGWMIATGPDSQLPPSYAHVEYGAIQNYVCGSNYP